MVFMISQDKIDEISRKVNIVEIIDQYVPLKKRGKNYFGYCPFHDERTPSFSVAEDKQIFKCFSCGRAGNVFKFFIEKDNISYNEAVQQVAELVNVPLSERELAPVVKSKETIEQENLIAMHEEAVNLYHYILMNTVNGEEALNYLLQRGFTLETIKTFQLGVSLDNREMLVKQFEDKKFSQSLYEKSGLIISYDNKSIDRFFNRIMFPLRNDKGQCVGFSGRIYKNDVTIDENFKQPKYLNSPETVIFNKSTFLFNYDLAKKESRVQSTIVLSEGYMDVIAMYQAGVHNVVASMGTSLTNRQIDQFKQIVSNVIIAYDGDNAGINATKRAIELIRENSHLSVHILPMIDNLDPDEIIRQKGATYFLNMLKNDVVSVFKFYKDFYKKQYVLTSEEGKSDYINALLKQIALENLPITQEIYLNEIAQEFSITADTLKKQLNYFKRQDNYKSQFKWQTILTDNNVSNHLMDNTLTPIQRAQRQLLYRALTNPEAFSLLCLYDDVFVEEDFIVLWLLYKDFRERNTFEVTIDNFLAELNDVKFTKMISDLLYLEFDANFTVKEIEDVMFFLQKATKEHEIKRYQLQIEEAQKSGDNERLMQLLKGFNDIIKNK